MISAIASFGIWPALPLTGFWLIECTRQELRARLPFFTVVSLACVLGIVTWSPVLLTLAMAGIFRPEYVGLAGWLVSLVAITRLRKVFISRISSTLCAWDYLLALGMVAAALLYLGFPTESIVGGWDPGVYANHGIYIANHGRLDIPYPWRRDEEVTFSQAFTGFSGVYQTMPTMTVQFGHLFPIWLAQAFSSFGHHGLFGLNAVFALLSLGIFYGCCRAIVPTNFAVIATLFLAFNPSQIWLARITLTEVFAQLLIWSGLLMMSIALKDKNITIASWAGACLGLAGWVRVDALLVVPVLFFTHFILKVIENSTGKDSIPVWLYFYGTAVPIFALAVGYYAFFSSPYFHHVSRGFKVIGIITLTSFTLLFAATPRILLVINRYLTKKAIMMSIGFILLGILVYGYWIRPVVGPFSVFDSYQFATLCCTRDYRELSFVNLAKYLSPLVLWVAVLGWFLALRGLIQQKRNSHMAVILVVVLSFSVVFLWFPAVNPIHYWAIRRFVPVIIPGFIFYAALGTWSAVNRLPGKLSQFVSAFIVMFLFVFLVRADAPIVDFSEDKGLFLQLQRLAEKLPNNEPILVYGSFPTWTLPLYVAFERRVIPVDFSSEEKREDLRKWIADRTAKQKAMYLLSEDSLGLRGLNSIQEDEVVITRIYSERVVYPLPRRVVRDQTKIRLYKITGTSVKAGYVNVTLGSQTDWGVEESGFHNQEWVENSAVRWTKGSAKLAVPVKKQHLLRKLEINLASTGKEGTRLQVLVNGYELFRGPLPRGEWIKTFDLTDVPSNKLVSIELLSDTFVPKDVIVGSNDPRKLGVCVRSIRLLR